MANAGYQIDQGALELAEDEGLFTADNETFHTGNDVLADRARPAAIMHRDWRNDASFLRLNDLDDVVMNTAEIDAKDIAEFKQFERAEFALDNAPSITLSAFVCKNIEMDSFNLRDFLTRPPIQRDPDRVDFTLNGVRTCIEYDIVHFKTDTFDEVYSRQVLHYEIAQAVHRQTVAEDLIRKTGYKILYAVPDAQIVLLINHLGSRAKATSYGVLHDAADIRDVEIDEQDPVTGFNKVRTETKLGKPYYIREVTDEAIVGAFQSLITPCIMFCVGQKIPVKEPIPDQSEEGMINGVCEQEVEEKKEAKRQKIEELTKASNDRRHKKENKAKILQELYELEHPVYPEQVEGEDYTVQPLHACAFFEDKISPGEEEINPGGHLDFNTTVHYWEMPYDQLPKQPFSFVRGEGFKVVPEAKDQSDNESEAFD